MSRLSDQVCDGVAYCDGGEDESSSICSHRRGRQLTLDHNNLFHDKDSSSEENGGFLSEKILVIFGSTVTVSLAVLTSLTIILYNRKLRKGASKDFISIELSKNQH